MNVALKNTPTFHHKHQVDADSEWPSQSKQRGDNGRLIAMFYPFKLFLEICLYLIVSRHVEKDFCKIIFLRHILWLMSLLMLAQESASKI